MRVAVVLALVGLVAVASAAPSPKFGDRFRKGVAAVKSFAKGVRDSVQECKGIEGVSGIIDCGKEVVERVKNIIECQKSFLADIKDTTDDANDADGIQMLKDASPELQQITSYAGKVCATAPNLPFGLGDKIEPMCDHYLSIVEHEKADQADEVIDFFKCAHKAAIAA